MDVKKQVDDTIAQAVVKVAKDPRTDLNLKDARPVAERLSQELGPLIINATNNEPWYQSTVIWGAIIAGLMTIAKPVVGDLGIDDAKIQEVVASLATAGQFFGIAVVLYGRLANRKPIGS